MFTQRGGLEWRLSTQGQPPGGAGGSDAGEGRPWQAALKRRYSQERALWGQMGSLELEVSRGSRDTQDIQLALPSERAWGQQHPSSSGRT